MAVSHLFFANDLVLFGKADMKNCLSMMDALEGFCGVSGQKINKEKSRVYFSPNVIVSEHCVKCWEFNQCPSWVNISALL